MSQSLKPAIKAVITDNNGHILFLSQQLEDKTIWDLPGGKMEFGESPLQTLHREVKEEINADITVGQCLGMWWFFHSRSGDQICCTTYHATLVEHHTLSLDENPSHEGITSYAWLSKAALLSENYELHPSLKSLLEQTIFQ